ncbi:hypothetical protein BKA69DRAFT_1176177 [Paraphysoderma sedebokerense]|nr:hypothetical protein BKA69DRAFT_1176177 [Paraphysoderma sedebokerense]
MDRDQASVIIQKTYRRHRLNKLFKSIYDEYESIFSSIESDTTLHRCGLPKQDLIWNRLCKTIEETSHQSCLLKKPEFTRTSSQHESRSKTAVKISPNTVHKGATPPRCSVSLDSHPSISADYHACISHHDSIESSPKSRKSAHSGAPTTELRTASSPSPSKAQDSDRMRKEMSTQLRPTSSPTNTRDVAKHSEPNISEDKEEDIQTENDTLELQDCTCSDISIVETMEQGRKNEVKASFEVSIGQADLETTRNTAVLEGANEASETLDVDKSDEGENKEEFGDKMAKKNRRPGTSEQSNLTGQDIQKEAQIDDVSENGGDILASAKPMKSDTPSTVISKSNAIAVAKLNVLNPHLNTNKPASQSVSKTSTAAALKTYSAENVNQSLSSLYKRKISLQLEILWTCQAIKSRRQYLAMKSQVG